MLLVFIFWLITTFIFLSFGNILVSIWNKVLRNDDSFSFFDTFWLGLCSVGVFLLVTSLIFPINIYISVLLIAISLLYWGFNYRKGVRLVNSIREKISCLPLLLKVLLPVLAILIIASNLKNPVTYDANLYYFQTLMWNEQYSVVPGLGNLHSRFGFNSTFLLLSTLYYHPSYFPALFPLNSLFFFMVSSWLIIRLFDSKKILFQIAIFLSIYIIYRTYCDVFSSLSTDAATNIIILYILFSCILNNKTIEKRALVICLLSILCITFKLSSAPVCIIPLIVVYMLIKGKYYKQLSLLVIISGLIILPWCTRFVILTGYLIYPFPSIDLFSFDWKMPVRLVELEKVIVYAWAKVPAVPIQDSLNTPIREGWLVRHLIGTQISTTKVLYALIVLSPILILSCCKVWKRNWFILAVWFVSFSGVLLNFFTGPNPRFSQSFIIMAALSPFLYLPVRELPSKMAIPSWCGAFILFFLLYAKNIKESILDNVSGCSRLYAFLYKPEPLMYGNEDKSLFFYEYTIGGIVIYSTNAIGEDPEICYESCNDQCFNQELPCTPYLNANLELRGKSLQDGFRIKE